MIAAILLNESPHKELLLFFFKRWGSCGLGCMKIIHETIFNGFVLVILSAIAACSLPSVDSESVNIISYQFRNRVVTLQQPCVRSSLIVGFKVGAGGPSRDNLTIDGELSLDGTPVGRDTISNLDGTTGCLSFDIPHHMDLSDRDNPYFLPVGLYSVQLRVKNREGKVVAELRKNFSRNQLGRTFVANGHEFKPFRILPALEKRGTPAVSSVNARVDHEEGTLFAHSPQERLFAGSVPGNGLAGKEITIRAARGEIRSIAVSLRAKRKLGVVSPHLSPLKNAGLSILRVGVNWGVVRDLSEVVREDTKRATLFVRRAPRLIEQGTTTVGRDETRSFWLTLAIPVDAVPGTYRGSIGVWSQTGELLALPVTVEVLPFTLPEPDIRYGMMMDYAFHELDNPGYSADDKRTLLKRGEEVYRDFRAHGMTVAYPHSYHFYRTDDKGGPTLDGLKAALDAYRAQGFTGPFVWYLGHFLHTAKPQHPGSILLYDEAVAVRRLRALLAELELLCRKKEIAKEKVLIQVVDEPDLRDRVRTLAGEKLHRIVREMGFRTLVTRPWPGMDVICTLEPDDDVEAGRLRNTAGEWWIYPNDALTGQNLSYARYVFGFGAWRWGVNGVVPWTYQMSQGSNGNPFTVLDGPEIMVAYPGAAGPISTPVWETIRDGINDYRYIQALRDLIARAKSRGDQRGARAERELDLLKKSLGAGPTEAEGNYGAWPPGSFDAVRGRIIALMGELR